MSLWSRLRENLPDNKPEFWRAPLWSVKRRLGLRLLALRQPGFQELPQVVTLAHDGLRMEVVPSEVIGHALAVAGLYEYAPTQLVRAYLLPGDLFVDVGANIGYYALLAAKRVGEGGRVMAFEPFRPVRERLQRNVALNGLATVDVFDSALGATAGSGHLCEPADSSNAGTARLSDGPGEGTSPVRVTTLDAALEGREPALLKIDVEGHEAEVFQGARQLLSQPEAPAILFESFRLEDDAELLEAYGYQLFAPALVRGAVTLVAARGAPHYRQWEAPNYLAVKGRRGVEFAKKLRRSER